LSSNGEPFFSQSGRPLRRCICPQTPRIFRSKKRGGRRCGLQCDGVLDFITFLHGITKTKCKHIYYCLPHEKLSEGLGIIQNDGDYREFVECGEGSPRKKIDVYLDHFNEPLFDWIEMEDPDEDEADVSVEAEEEESVFSDAVKTEHELDEVVSKPIVVDDPFLNAKQRLKQMKQRKKWR